MKKIFSNQSMYLLHIYLSVLGDYAVLIQSGFSHYRALLLNFLSATTAIIGFFIGAVLSSNDNARQWIFAVTIGMFLYISLGDLVCFIETIL